MVVEVYAVWRISYFSRIVPGRQVGKGDSAVFGWGRCPLVVDALQPIGIGGLWRGVVVQCGKFDEDESVPFVETYPVFVFEGMFALRGSAGGEDNGGVVMLCRRRDGRNDGESVDATEIKMPVSPLVGGVPIEICVGESVLLREIMENLSFGVEARQSVQGGNPDVAVLVFYDAPDAVVNAQICIPRCFGVCLCRSRSRLCPPESGLLWRWKRNRLGL